MYPDDYGTGVKPKYFLRRGIRYTPSYDTIQQMCDRDQENSKRQYWKKNKISWMYLSS